MASSKERARALFVICYLLFVISSASNAFAQTLPKPSGRVNDFANVIDPAVEAEIDRRLELLEQTTSSEIAVATITSLGGMSSSDYANRLFKEWGVGQARTDNGVLVVIATGDRDMAIEVGYGLEGVLPDGLAGQIIRDDFTPRFRAGDYSGGIRNGVMRLADIVEKQQVLTPEELAKFNADSGSADFPAFIGLPFFGLFVAIGFGMFGVGLRSKTGFPVLFGSLFGGMPLLMSLAFLGRLSLMTLFPFALVMLVAGYRLGGRPAWRDAFRNTGTRGTSGTSGSASGGWTMGGGSGSSRSSSGPSSSGGSFGGGSSGGGGASGKW
jgi:uncharacterized protein